jgi:hypothetical protein
MVMAKGGRNSNFNRSNRTTAPKGFIIRLLT